MADFINRVTEHFDELTKSHKEVANYFFYIIWIKLRWVRWKIWPVWWGQHHDGNPFCQVTWLLGFYGASEGCAEYCIK